MNEIERIINNGGNLVRNGISPEIREDYYISEDKKKLWLIQLDLLRELDRVCRKHGLKYFLGYGSLLGAIRHKGFIPWDDDIDVIMFRNDYDKLCELDGEFNNPYFLQTVKTDGNNGYYYSYIKVRNSNTTFISNVFKYQKFNMGIFIDIFCFDKWDLQNGEERYEQIRKLIIDNSNCMRSSNPNPNEQEKKRILQYSGNNPIDNLKKIDELAKQRANESKFLCSSNMTLHDYKKSIFEKNWFDRQIIINFEKLEVPVPVGYDKILKTIYGDYMVMPPKDKRNEQHNTTISVDIPYELYLYNEKSGV